MLFYLVVSVKDKSIKPPPLMLSWEIYKFFKAGILKNTSEQWLLCWFLT